MWKTSIGHQNLTAIRKGEDKGDEDGDWDRDRERLNEKPLFICYQSMKLRKLPCHLAEYVRSDREWDSAHNPQEAFLCLWVPSAPSALHIQLTFRRQPPPSSDGITKVLKKTSYCYMLSIHDVCIPSVGWCM